MTARLHQVGFAALLLGILAAANGGFAASNPGLTQEPAVRATPEQACARRTMATPESLPMATEGDLALIEAARDGDAGAVERWLAEGAGIHARDANSMTALIAAAWGNHLEVSCALIAAGADVNAQDDTEQSAYLIATSEGYLELLEMTLEAGADVHALDSYRGTALIRAAERGHVEVVERLLQTEIAVDHVNRLGLTALLEAIMFGDGGPRHTEVVRLLVAANADINLADGSGVTPLAHAQRRGYTEMAAILGG